MKMFISGTALKGEADHVHLKEAPYLGMVKTAPKYRQYSIRDEFPGLVPVETGGCSITGELYDLPEETWLNSLQPNEPPELRLGTVALSDGTVVNGMLLDQSRVADGEANDISSYGGWKIYRLAHVLDAKVDPRNT
jgi:gamma-glutamylcyclotransferase (GGCT)/AIG2-like uncharacterized protein YtfP